MEKEELKELIREIIKEELEYHCEIWHYGSGYEE